MAPSDAAVRARLEDISTRWSLLKDPMQFLFRYGPAIRSYLAVLLANPDDADEICQDILVRVVRDGFAGATPEKGRFRSYLKVAVRNAALMHLRRRRPAQPPEELWQQLADADHDADRAWLADWQRCALNKAWRALEAHERTNRGNLFATSLRVSVDSPGLRSDELAALVSEQVGRSVSAVALRKQLSRARQMFAKLLVEEVKQTLQDPTPEAIAEELIELGLMPYVRDYL